MAITAKTFTAVKAFSCAGRNFQEGDVVADPVVLNVVTGYGEQFVIADTKRTRKATSTETEGA